MDPYGRDSTTHKDPPRSFWATLRQLGPGMILAGSIVGSGELIMTTKLGAVAGFTFLWFVLISCFLKVVVQAEIARHTISSGQTFLTVFNSLPGPATTKPSWLSLTWLAVVLASSVVATIVFVMSPESSRNDWLVVGLVGFAVFIPAGVAWLRRAKSGSSNADKPDTAPVRISWFTWLWLAFMLLTFINSGAILGAAGQTIEMLFPNRVWGGASGWSVIIAAVAAALLLSGSYLTLERALIVLVALFTLLAIICTVSLQKTEFAMGWSDVGKGLMLGIPDPTTAAIVLTALSMYAGTGVAFGEMWNYTYWCIEKGYARNVGETEPNQNWATRARGWIRVMYVDVLFTMVVYTISTVCFYFLGAAVLHAQGLNPDGHETIEVLSRLFTDSLGNWSATLFVVGGFFVLFSTVLSGVAGSSRLMADALGVMGIIDPSDFPTRLKFIRIFVVLSLAMYSLAYWLFQNPPQMLLITSSIIGAVMYPVLGLGVLYLRHYSVDPRIRPGSLVTVWLWICAISLTVISPGGIVIALLLNYGWL